MVGGALGGLLIAIVYTLVTGKLVLNKSRHVYDGPARLAAGLGLVPLIGAVAWVFASGRQGTGEAIGAFVGAILLSIVVMYGVGWKYGEPPR